MRIPAWRGFLGCGLVASVAYFLLPDVERIAAASSAVLHYAAAAVVAGIRLHRPADRRPWYLVAAALLAFGTGDSLVFSPVRDLSDACFLGAYVALTIALLRLVRSRSHGRDLRPCWTRWSSRPGSGCVVAVPDGPVRSRPGAVA